MLTTDMIDLIITEWLETKISLKLENDCQQKLFNTPFGAAFA